MRKGFNGLVQTHYETNQEEEKVFYVKKRKDICSSYYL